MAPKFALFTKGSKMPLNQGFQNRFLVTTVSRQALDMFHNISYFTTKQYFVVTHIIGLKPLTYFDAFALDEILNYCCKREKGKN